MLDSDIKTYHAAEVSANTTNGGRRSTTEVISGVVNNVWPHVTKAQRLSGHTLHRLLHTLVADDSDGTLIAAEEYLDNPTDGDDHIVAFKATNKDDTQADITGSERKYGSGLLNADVSAATGPVTFAVDVEHLDYATGTHAIFKVGDKIRITDKATPDSVTGNEEFLDVTTVTNVDTLVTITVSNDLANTYTVLGGTKVSSLMEFSDVETSSDAYVVTTAGTGDYDYASYPLVLDNIGTVEDSLTFDFTSATAFTCTGSSGINYGSGTTGADFEPLNTGMSNKPYFKLEFAGFSGVWASGDKLEVDVHDAAFAFWLKRTVPAGCASLNNNKLVSCTIGESDA